MPVHERELAERANAELLRQIEESLAHSRDIIAQVNEVIAQINELRAQRRANFQRVGSWRLMGLNLSRKLDSKWVN